MMMMMLRAIMKNNSRAEGASLVCLEVALVLEVGEEEVEECCRRLRSHGRQFGEPLEDLELPFDCPCAGEGSTFGFGPEDEEAARAALN